MDQTRMPQQGMKEWRGKYANTPRACVHTWSSFLTSGFSSFTLRDCKTMTCPLAHVTHDTREQHKAQTAQGCPRPFTFSWEAAAFPSSLFSSISSSLHSQSPSSVLWRWPLDPGTRLTCNNASHLAECTQHWLVLLPGLYSLPETQKINLSGYQPTDNWKVAKDHSSCRLPRSTSFQKYCVLETH